ncbi:concanavalin A-like lectin/glucanase domain-containing protein [Aspergillus unguis]
MTRFGLAFLPNLSLITSAVSIVLPPTNTNFSKLAPRVPGHYPCDCYQVSGDDPGYFTHYKLWDFRNVPLPHSLNSGAFDPSDGALWEAETIPLSQTDFKNDWLTQSWSRSQTIDSTIPMANADSNAFFARHPNIPDASQLVLRTTRFEDHSSSAEIESQHGNFHRCSIRVRMRLMSKDAITRRPEDETPDVNAVPKGACAGIFTYRSATCESDVEFLTSDPRNTIHYANQPDYDAVNDVIIPGASKTVTTVPTPWSEWTTHRMDWFVNTTSWYVDDMLQAVVSQSVPDRPSIIAMNLWSDGGIWTGDMHVGESVYMGVEWIEIAYNTSLTGDARFGTDQRHRQRPSDYGKADHHAKRQMSGTEEQTRYWLRGNRDKAENRFGNMSTTLMLKTIRRLGTEA